MPTPTQGTCFINMSVGHYNNTMVFPGIARLSDGPIATCIIPVLFPNLLQFAVPSFLGSRVQLGKIGHVPSCSHVVGMKKIVSKGVWLLALVCKKQALNFQTCQCCQFTYPKHCEILTFSSLAATTKDLNTKSHVLGC